MENYSAENLYDVIVIGGGPAGLTAAIYLARAKYRVLVIEKEQFGGQITITDEVVNYPGIRKTSGKELTKAMREQAEAFGAEFLSAEAIELKTDENVKVVKTNKGELNCLGVLISTGAHPRTVGFKGEDEFKGRGVAYCATCDGEFFSGKEVFVIGGGYAAAEESVFLTKFARKVTILMRDDDFTCAAAVSAPARSHEKITVVTNTEVEEVSGNNGLNYIKYKNLKTGKVTEYRTKEKDTFGVFVFAGYSPDTKLVEGIAELNEHGYIITNKEQKTSAEGIYAAGDVCIKPLRQVVTATADGALAATELEKYVADMQRKTGLHPKQPQTKESTKAPQNPNHDFRENDGEIFTDDVKEQLKNLFRESKKNLVLNLFLDNRPISSELENMMMNLSEIIEKVTVSVIDRSYSSEEAPFVEVCLEDGTHTGISFHGVPGGHEFTSFVIGLYNASSAGQNVDEDTLQKIKDIKVKTNIKILVSLSCTMCPDLVTACQRIATLNENVKVDVFDVQHFRELAEKYSVMSVPCLVINDSKVFFGKKNINQILELIG